MQDSVWNYHKASLPRLRRRFYFNYCIFCLGVYLYINMIKLNTGFCEGCSSKERCVPERQWYNPVRVCDYCYERDNNSNEEDTPDDVSVRKVSEHVVSAISAVGSVLNYSKSKFHQNCISLLKLFFDLCTFSLLIIFLLFYSYYQRLSSTRLLGSWLRNRVLLFVQTKFLQHSGFASLQRLWSRSLSRLLSASRTGSSTWLGVSCACL